MPKNNHKYINIIIVISIMVVITILIIRVVQDNKPKYSITENLILDSIDTNSTQELFSKFYEKAEEQLKQLSLEEKVSQMFMARCPQSGANETISKYKIGGYILFSKDFEGKTKQEVINTIKEFQNRSKLPMIISVDEEGGSVCRVSTNTNLRKEKFKSPQELYEEGGIERIYEDTVEKSKLLLNLGINMNLAPVADVSTNKNDYMYKRTFGKNEIQTSKYVETVVKAMKNENIAGTLKHFPGYGNNKDSHKQATYDNRTIQEFEKIDFLPFKAGIQNGVETVLVSHNIINAIDSKNPASISKKVHELLRNEFQFTGLIITDDLSMGATKNFANTEELAVIAVEAGNDIILTTDFVKQREAVINAVNMGRIKEDKIDEAVRRIIAFKYYMKLM